MKRTTKNNRFTKCRAASGLLAIALLAILYGCTQKVAPEIQTLRERLVLKSAPADHVAVMAIRERLLSDGAPDQVPVVIRGRIHAGDAPPWETGKAAFALTDASGHDGDDDHDPWACPFCSRKIEDYIVNVYFRDDDGEAIAIDSRELFDVSEKEMVVITGAGTLNENNTLVVNASNIFIQD